MNEHYKLLDIVALLNDIPQKKLFRGQVGTIVEKHSSNVFEVEFIDNDGLTYALTSLDKKKIIKLKWILFQSVNLFTILRFTF